MSVNEGYNFIVNENKTVVEKPVPLKGNNKNFRKKKLANKDCLKSVRKKYKAWKTKTAENYRKYCVARNHYVPHRREGGHIVFGADPLASALASA